MLQHYTVKIPKNYERGEVGKLHKCTDELFTLVRKQPEERSSKISICGHIQYILLHEHTRLEEHITHIHWPDLRIIIRNTGLWRTVPGNEARLAPSKVGSKALGNLEENVWLYITDPSKEINVIWPITKQKMECVFLKSTNQGSGTTTQALARLHQARALSHQLTFNFQRRSDFDLMTLLPQAPVVSVLQVAPPHLANHQFKGTPHYLLHKAHKELTWKPAKEMEANTQQK